MDCIVSFHCAHVVVLRFVPYVVPWVSVRLLAQFLSNVLFVGSVDNIKVNLLEVGLSVVDWIGLAQDRYRWRALVNTVMNL
jgi:hypothetical protein